MKKVFYLTILVFSFINLKAQEASSWRFNLQGFNVIFPGVEVAYEYPLLSKKLQLKSDKSHLFQIIIAPEFETYFYFGNHAGIGLNADLSLRYRLNKGFQFQVFGSLGALAAMLSGEVYEQNPDGSFSSSSLKGNLYTQRKMGIGFSKNLREKPYDLNLRLGIRETKFPAAPITPHISIGVNYFVNAKSE